MELLSDYFELIDLVFGASAVYRLTKPIPQWLLEEPLEQLSLQEKVSYIDRAIEKAPASAGEVLKCARAYCLVEHGDFLEAERTLAMVNPSISDPDPSRDFSLIADSNRLIVANILERAKLKGSE